MKSEKQYGLILRNRNRDIRHSEGYGIMEVSIVEVTNTDTVRNPDSDHEFNDLQFCAQWSVGEKEGDRTYGWEACYRERYRVRLGDAQRMVKTLRKIESAFQRSKIKPVTFGQYVTVVSLALGIKCVMKESIRSVDSLTYSERDFQRWDISDAAFLIDGQIHTDRYPPEPIRPTQDAQVPVETSTTVAN